MFLKLIFTPNKKDTKRNLTRRPYLPHPRTYVTTFLSWRLLENVSPKVPLLMLKLNSLEYLGCTACSHLLSVYHPVRDNNFVSTLLLLKPKHHDDEDCNQNRTIYPNCYCKSLLFVSSYA